MCLSTRGGGGAYSRRFTVFNVGGKQTLDTIAVNVTLV